MELSKLGLHSLHSQPQQPGSRRWSPSRSFPRGFAPTYTPRQTPPPASASSLLLRPRPAPPTAPTDCCCCWSYSLWWYPSSPAWPGGAPGSGSASPLGNSEAPRRERHCCRWSTAQCLRRSSFGRPTLPT
uniref:Uncharacterized protein n=1 Tax=Opuntia streptacantha TaxID=393608 RepID=A0A7C9ESP1_OPUST